MQPEPGRSPPGQIPGYLAVHTLRPGFFTRGRNCSSLLGELTRIKDQSSSGRKMCSGNDKKGKKSSSDLQTAPRGHGGHAPCSASSAARLHPALAGLKPAWGTLEPLQGRSLGPAPLLSRRPGPRPRSPCTPTRQRSHGRQPEMPLDG